MIGKVGTEANATPAYAFDAVYYTLPKQEKIRL
jgi:hypothetical protein